MEIIELKQSIKQNNSMTLVLHRTIHPVGQGAFYSEVFENNGDVKFTMVYDCGTETPDKKMDLQLNDQIIDFSDRVNNRIDLLFISHFHKDHISGLNYLTQKCKVKKTIIPMLTDELILLTRVSNLFYYGSEALTSDMIIRELFFGGEGDNGHFGDVYVVSPYDDEDSRVFDHDKNIDNVYPRQNAIIRCGEIIEQEDVFWKYRPFNSISPSCQKARDLKIRLLNDIPWAFGLNGDFDARTIVGKHLDVLKKDYKDVMGGANDNIYTLVVESSPVKGIMHEEEMKKCRGLYYGDFDYLKSGKCPTMVSPAIYSEIGFVQVPHHGSKRNWHTDFLRGAPRQYVISAGTTNGYHHPSYWVVKEIKDNGNMINVVSEKATTELELEYVVR